MSESKETIEVPCIETERLILRGLSSDDVEFIFEHFSQDEINQYSSNDSLATMAEARQFVDKYIVPTNTRFRLGVVLKKTNALIGTLGYYGWSRKDCRAQIGCDLAKPYWGKGIMAEALEALIQFGFVEMKLNRIEATTNSRNKRAITLIEKLGFTKEGILRQKYHYKGKFHNDVVYSLLKQEWET